MTPARERARTPAFAPAPWRRTLAWLMTSLCAWACICATLSRPAKAHDFRPAVLAIKQVEPGSYVTRWSPPRLSPGQTAVSPRFPDPCEIDGARLSCGPSGLTAPITFEGLAGTNIEVVVMFAGLDGETQTRVVEVQTQTVVGGRLSQNRRREHEAHGGHPQKHRRSHAIPPRACTAIAPLPSRCRRMPGMGATARERARGTRVTRRCASNLSAPRWPGLKGSAPRRQRIGRLPTAAGGPRDRADHPRGIFGLEM